MSVIDLPKSLLIVDDQITNLTLLSRFLSEYHVITVDGGALAIEKALEILPDLILLDINMPDIDGYQVCETLKKSSATTDIPIIFITGLSDPGQVNKGFEVGAIDYITKPFSLSEVRARVRNSLALKSASESLIKKNVLLENIIREQSISSELARQVLRFINRDPARYIDLGQDLSLFVHTISQPCYNEGGDHCFVRTLASADSISPRTVLSVKDQSGHSVNCILRSIATDLAHNGIIKNNPGISVAESISHLNHAVLQGGIFAEDDFFTGLTLELHHDSLELNYVSAGHPSFLLIRENDVFALPKRGGEGTNLPIAFTDDLTYSSASIKLEAGDRLLLFTDGLTDISLDCADSCFTIEDLVNILKSIPSLADRPVSYLIQELLHELLSRCHMSNDPDFALFPDDITLMGVEIESPPPPEVLRVIPADFENIDACVSYILMVLSESISRNNFQLKTQNIIIPTSEAVLNAWKHGNEKDSRKAIVLKWWFANDLNLEIFDQGDGFNYHHFINPTTHDNLTRDSGRGIFLIRKFCSYVRWRDEGRMIILFFAIHHTAWELSSTRVDRSYLDIW